MTQTTKQKIIWWTSWTLYALFFRLILRARVHGRENIPSEGPVFVLANHTSLLDPPNVGIPIRRVTHFMATEQLFRANRFLAWLITNLNAFPKAKGVVDRRAMKRMLRAYRDGDAVVFFPEGVRSWTGRTLPMVDNTAAFLKRMKARVVYCRIKTGHLILPRWARFPRWTPLVLEYSPLFEYDDPDITVEQIEQHMTEHLRVVPEITEAEGRGIGMYMADGLPGFLWACPNCFTPHALEVTSNNANGISCLSCQASWVIDLSQRLHSQQPGVPDLTVASASDRICAHFGEPPVANAERFARDGIVLEEDHITISKILPNQKQPIFVCRGKAQLSPQRISVTGDDGDELWGVALTEVKAVLDQLGNKLHIRTPDGNFQFDPDFSSTTRWSHFLNSHYRLSQQ